LAAIRAFRRHARNRSATSAPPVRARARSGSR
jgi:hypothetical protein